MNDILSFILPFLPLFAKKTKRWDSHSFSVSPLFRKKKEKGEWMRKSHSFSFILPFSWMRCSHSFSLFPFFWAKWGRNGEKKSEKGGMNENEWENLIHSHSFSLFSTFWKKSEKGRMNEKISFILIHSHFWNFNKRSSFFFEEKISVPALFLRRK